MTDSIIFTLPGNPTAKGRPRFFNGRAVTDTKTRIAEQNILATYLLAGGDKRTPHEGPVTIHVSATFVPAQSWPKWKRTLALSGQWPHTSKPDLDNLIKVIDGLNGVAWLDDSQISHVSASKQYGELAKTSVQIWFHKAPEKP